jgi:hypothetical protein
MSVKEGRIDVRHHLFPPAFEGETFRERGQRVAAQAIGKVLDRRHNR